MLFTKQIVTAVLMSMLMIFSFTFAFAAEEKVPIETAKAAPAAAAAPEEKPTGDFTVSALSQYIWRGYELSRNSIVVQPSATIGYKGFSVNVWGNLDTRPYFAGTGDTNYASTWNETDLTLSYSKTLGLFNLGGGYIYYGLGALNPDAPKRMDSQEIFATVGLNTILTPTLTVYREIDHYHNWYFLLGVSHLFEFNKVVSLKLAATASYLQSTDETTYPKFDGNAVATTDKFSNFHDGNLTVSLPIKATSYITLTPTISYVFPLSEDAKNEMKGFGLSGKTPADRDSSFLYGGLAVSFSF
ncbi:MAG: hypothetical protein M0P16_12995 [Syntrophales bacterium]|jgi:hypothetical protein|nr:hypothetical protein [Syntrophales bacterium]MCK9393062.1 hypothetical protein [Syntrophales bacterium]